MLDTDQHALLYSQHPDPPGGPVPDNIDIRSAQFDATAPKHELIKILRALELCRGCKRKAKALDKIIWRLECWQNTP